MTTRRRRTTTTSTFVIVLLSAVVSLTDATSAGGPYTPQQVDHWLDSRCGESGSAIWAYEGALYDPLDGRKICAVEGIELVRRLPILSSTEDNPSNLLKMEQLEERGYTVLSRKLFCYPSPEAPRKLLDVIKLRHNSPLRNIPTHQAMAVYDCATTFLGRRNGTELVVHTEFPNGKCYWSTATSGAKQALLDSTSTSTMDFTVYTKKRRSDVPELSNTSEAEMFVSPKRSRLIQFGAAPKQEQEGRYGARETYSYTFQSKNATPKFNLQFWRKTQNIPSSSCILQYTRYGEGPPWYRTGTYCQLELTGRRVDHVSELPPLAASVAAKQSGFLTVASPIVNSQQAIRWFRQDSLSSIFHDDDKLHGPDGSLQRSIYNIRKLGEEAWQSVRRASSHKQGQRPSGKD